MINLLPPAVIQDYRYGLRNTVLLRWISSLIVALIGLGLIATYGLATLQHSTKAYDAQVSATQASLTAQHLSGTETQVKTISGNLKLVVQVLSKEILFSKLLTQIATVVPPNTVLKGLDISQTTGGIDLTAAASDYQTATQVQVNLSDPANQIFSKADIVSINCANTSEDTAHPCVVQIRALFAKNNPYLFVNSQAGH